MRHGDAMAADSGGRIRVGHLGLLLVLACQPGGDGRGSTSTAGTADLSSTGSSSASPPSTSTAATSEPTTNNNHGETPSTTSTDPTTSSTSTTTTTTTGDALVALQIEPAHALVTVASGWSFPVRFEATALDGGGNEVAVDVEWSLDDPALGEVTRHGGAFQASNTAAGVATITASAAGLQASAEVSVELAGDLPTCPPRPPLVDGEPAPGLFVKVVAPEYEGTGVYHGVYLPPDWQPGRRYPVIVESPCNQYGAFTGKVDDATLGYYLAGCRGYLWIVVPYVQGQANLDFGWGDVPATLAYWQTNVARALAAHGGDASAVVAAGFSRGAIGASFIGLGDPAIADTWLGFVMHSHADVVTNLTPDQGAGSAARMERVWGRAAWLSWGAAGDGGAPNSLKGVELLTAFGYPVTTLAVPAVGHTDAWMADDAASRKAAQQWLFATVAARPGTHAIRGRVVDGEGHGIAGTRIASGAHTTWTDDHGHYALRGLVPGLRQVECSHPRLTCSSGQAVDLAGGDVDDIDFVAAP